MSRPESSPPRGGLFAPATPWRQATSFPRCFPRCSYVLLLVCAWAHLPLPPPWRGGAAGCECGGPTGLPCGECFWPPAPTASGRLVWAMWDRRTVPPWAGARRLPEERVAATAASARPMDTTAARASARLRGQDERLHCCAAQQAGGRQGSQDHRQAWHAPFSVMKDGHRSHARSRTDLYCQQLYTRDPGRPSCTAACQATHGGRLHAHVHRGSAWHTRADGVALAQQAHG